MAQHRDDRSSTPADERLRSLYTQRKATHRAPDSLNRAVLDRARAHNRPRRSPGRWTRVVPPVAAAFVVMVLGLQWLRDPAGTVLDESAARLSQQPSPPTEMLEAPDSAGQSREHADTFDTQPRAPASAPSPEKQTPAASALSDSTADRTLAEPMAEAEKPSRPRYLRAIPGETDVFEQCDGTLLRQAIDRAPSEGWFEVTWSANERIEHIDPLNRSPCEPAPP